MFKSVLPVKILLTLLILAALFWLGRVGVADFMRLSPCAYVDAINRGAVVSDPVELDKAVQRLKLAQSWDASNPVMPEYLAQIDFMYARQQPFNPGLQTTLLNSAILNMNRAVSLRPNSAYLWAARMTMGNWLLIIQAQPEAASYQAQLSDVIRALRRAAVLDPWNPFILRQIVETGRWRYAEMTAQDKLVVDAATLRAQHLGI